MDGALTAYNKAKRALAQAGITDSLEARVLFETASGLARAGLTREDTISENAASALNELVSRRIAGEPLQYLAGSWPFLDFELSVGEGVLIPRPETELLAQTAIDFLSTRENPTALDLCSGSGCVAIAIKRALPKCTVSALERSSEALSFLKKNTIALAGGITVIEADVFDYSRAPRRASLDCITCNPPYLTPSEYDTSAELAHEPREAFVAGRDGLDFYRHIIPNYKPLLKEGGALIFETGFTQTEAVAGMMSDAGYCEVKALSDQFGNPRVVLGTA